MPEQPEQIAEAGRKLVGMLGACAAAPDDVAIGQAADNALNELEQLLAAAEPATPAERRMALGDGVIKGLATARNNPPRAEVLLPERIPVGYSLGHERSANTAWAA